MDTSQDNLIKITTEIYKLKYPEAKVVFLSGSIVRGEGTSTSDLDLVVVFDQLRCAYRDSYFFKEWPVEVFVHDLKTLEYFFREVDRPTGVPTLATMVSEGIEVPEANEFTQELKQLALSVLNEGPPEWTEKDINYSRYMITDMVNDLKDPRNLEEMRATAMQLYSALANHYFRSKKNWSAKGKAIPRKLNATDSGFANRFLDSFDTLFTKKNPDKVIELSAEMLEENGGFFFEGFKSDAPESWRIK